MLKCFRHMYRYKCLASKVDFSSKLTLLEQSAIKMHINYSAGEIKKNSHDFT